MDFDWNDLRVFAAVLEHGSTARAAKALGVDQTTCSRRIAALEQALGLQLFVREPTGYRPTPAGEVLEPAVSAVAAEVGRFASQVETAARRGARRIRVTSEEFVTRTFLVPALAKFSSLHPDAKVDVDVSTAYRDLQAGEADLAIRAGAPPEELGLIRRLLREDEWGVYCNAAYAESPGAPANLAEAAAHPLVIPEAALDETKAAGLGDAVRQVVNSLGAVEAMIRRGGCIGPLPHIIAEGASDLRLCFTVQAEARIWLVYPERLRHVPEVRTLVDCIAEAFRKSGGQR